MPDTHTQRLSCDSAMGSCLRCGNVLMLPAGYAPAAEICDDCVSHLLAIELMRDHGLTVSDQGTWYITYELNCADEEASLPHIIPDYDTRYEEAADFAARENWLASVRPNDCGGFGYPESEF